MMLVGHEGPWNGLAYFVCRIQAVRNSVDNSLSSVDKSKLHRTVSTNIVYRTHKIHMQNLNLSLYHNNDSQSP